MFSLLLKDLISDFIFLFKYDVFVVYMTKMIWLKQYKPYNSTVLTLPSFEANVLKDD